MLLFYLFAKCNVVLLKTFHSYNVIICTLLVSKLIVFKATNLGNFTARVYVTYILPCSIFMFEVNFSDCIVLCSIYLLFILLNNLFTFFMFLIL